MKSAVPIRRRSSEEGYILLWVIFLLAVFTISLSVAVPAISKEIERDRERETMERGKQYQRAIQLYYKKFHAYPPNVNALVNTNQIRFLRKKYIDPMTGKDDWKPILFGQAKTQTLGFFGQPLAGAASAGGSVLAGIGPSGGNGFGNSPGFGGPGFGASNSSTNSSIGSSDTSGTPTGSPTDSSGNQTPGTGGTGSNGASGTSGGSNSTGSSGQTFGGAGIIGFSPGSPKQSILVFKKKNHFNEWEFVYDPLSDMKTVSGNTGNIGQPASSTTTPVGGSSIGSSTGNPTGSNTNSPVSPPASTPETTPQ
jgi:type II secretory pathway pseudopilin PulG